MTYEAMKLGSFAEAVKLGSFAEAVGEPRAVAAPNDTSYPHEEALETALVRNLNWATGLDLTFVCRAQSFQGRPDIFAVDGEGRLHIFELKKAKADRRAARQIDRYVAKGEGLLRFIDKIYEEQPTFDAGMANWAHTAALLAGFRTGIRSSTVKTKGRMREVNKVAARFPEWPKDDRRYTYRAAATLGLDREDLPALMTRLKQQAELLSTSLASGRATRRPNPSGPFVGWLVAPTITRYADQYLRSAAGENHTFCTLSLTLTGSADDWTLVRGPSNLIGGAPTQ